MTRFCWSTLVFDDRWAYRAAGQPSLATRVRVVSAPPEKPNAWAIASFYLAGAGALVFGVARWTTQSQAELAALSSGRGLVLPGWAWNLFFVVLGLAMFGFAIWATVRSRRFR